MKRPAGGENSNREIPLGKSAIPSGPHAHTTAWKSIEKAREVGKTGRLEQVQKLHSRFHLIIAEKQRKLSSIKDLHAQEG
jgi:hypothetical protein